MASKTVSNVLILQCNKATVEWQLPGRTLLEENQV